MSELRDIINTLAVRLDQNEEEVDLEEMKGFNIQIIIPVYMLIEILEALQEEGIDADCDGELDIQEFKVLMTHMGLYKKVYFSITHRL